MSAVESNRSLDPSDTERMRRALEIACAALDKPEPQRCAWAEAQCGQDASLRMEVLALLAADESPDELLSCQSARVERHDPWPGRLVGRFRIGERIGSGGMGTVYRAEPESGVGRRPVALKLIKRGMDSEEILRRFLRERDILARLDHPQIARLLDGGMTEAALQLDQRQQARRGLAEMRDAALAMAGRAAMRWHLLASQLALREGDLASGGAELAASRAAVPKTPGPLDQARWLQQAAALAEAGGDRVAATDHLRQAESLYRSRWAASAPALQQLQADLVRLEAAQRQLAVPRLSPPGTLH